MARLMAASSTAGRGASGLWLRRTFDLLTVQVALALTYLGVSVRASHSPLLSFAKTHNHLTHPSKYGFRYSNKIKQHTTSSK